MSAPASPAAPSSPSSGGGMSAGTIAAIAITVIGLCAIGYYAFVYEQDNLTADAKFNRQIVFDKEENPTTT